MSEPLSSLLRPKNIEEFVGQEQIIWADKPLSSFLKQGKVPSMLFRGPPGCGKTTLARIIADTIQADAFMLSGVTSKKEDLKKILDQAELNQKYGKQTLIFLDEIHRWNKAQQDTLLPFVEKGIITLVGATTENPSFSINNALLSRCRIFVFEAIKSEDINKFITAQMPQILKAYPEIIIPESAILLIAKLWNWDLRNSLNILETAISLRQTGEISEQDILNAGQKMVYYDKNGDEHYNIISAIHKSLRDSDGHAACYWIQRMLVGGEDPRYLARRMLRFASEDIGPADNNALLLANQVFDAVERIGMPECDIFLFQLALYLAKAPKNNITDMISIQTKQDIAKYGNLPVPLVIRNAPTQMMKDLNYGEGYKYAHDHPELRQADGTIKTDNQHFPDELKGRKYG